MGGEWELYLTKRLSITDQCRWKVAYKVLQDIARSRDLVVAGTICKVCKAPRCPNKAFLVKSFVRVPRDINAGFVQVCSDKTLSQMTHRGERFNVFGNCKYSWPSSKFCHDLEAVLGYLFPRKFSVSYDDYGCDSDRDVTYIVEDHDGTGLGERHLPLELDAEIRRLKQAVPPLSQLCMATLETRFGKPRTRRMLRRRGL